MELARPTPTARPRLASSSSPSSMSDAVRWRPSSSSTARCNTGRHRRHGPALRPRPDDERRPRRRRAEGGDPVDAGRADRSQRRPRTPASRSTSSRKRRTPERHRRPRRRSRPSRPTSPSRRATPRHGGMDRVMAMLADGRRQGAQGHRQGAMCRALSRPSATRCGSSRPTSVAGQDHPRRRRLDHRVRHQPRGFASERRRSAVVIVGFNVRPESARAALRQKSWA